MRARYVAWTKSINRASRNRSNASYNKRIFDKRQGDSGSPPAPNLSHHRVNHFKRSGLFKPRASSFVSHQKFTFTTEDRPTLGRPKSAIVLEALVSTRRDSRFNASLVSMVCNSVGNAVWVVELLLRSGTFGPNPLESFEQSRNLSMAMACESAAHPQCIVCRNVFAAGDHSLVHYGNTCLERFSGNSTYRR